MHRSEKIVLDVPFRDKDRAKAAGASWDSAEKKWIAKEGADFAALAPWLARQARPLALDALAFALHFPSQERAQAKAAGARWDPVRKVWFAPTGLEVALDRWKVAPALSTGGADPREAFATALQEAGLDVSIPIMDGTLRRVPLLEGKRGNKNGAYIGHEDGVARGFIQNFATGVKENWKCAGACGARMSASHRAAWSAQIELLKASRARQTEADYLAAADAALSRWEAMPKANPDCAHPYLARKGVRAHGLRTANGQLAIPARDIVGKLWTVQTIPAAPDAKKLFFKGGRKAGCFHLLADGPIPPGSDILFAEGYATGATLREATGLPVVVAFDAGNLLPVAMAWAQAKPSSLLVFMADDDRHGKANTGLERAREAAAAVGGAVVSPVFPDSSSTASDWNDLAREVGLDAARGQIATGLRAERIRLRDERASALLAEMPSAHVAGPDRSRERCSGWAKPVGAGFVAIVEASGRVSIHEARRMDVELKCGAAVEIAYDGGRARVANLRQRAPSGPAR